MLDSGFCVLNAIIELKRKGMFASAMIKKQRYWPSMIPGYAFDDHFIQKEVRDTDTITGSLDRISYHFWGMKESDYIMKMMAQVVDSTLKGIKRQQELGKWRHPHVQDISVHQALPP